MSEVFVNRKKMEGSLRIFTYVNKGLWKATSVKSKKKNSKTREKPGLDY